MTPFLIFYIVATVSHPERPWEGNKVFIIGVCLRLCGPAWVAVLQGTKYYQRVSF